MLCLPCSDYTVMEACAQCGSLLSPQTELPTVAEGLSGQRMLAHMMNSEQPVSSHCVGPCAEGSGRGRSSNVFLTKGFLLHALACWAVMHVALNG